MQLIDLTLTLTTWRTDMTTNNAQQTVTLPNLHCDHEMDEWLVKPVDSLDNPSEVKLQLARDPLMTAWFHTGQVEWALENR